MLGVMAKPEQLNGLISLVSNSAYSATGYGTQAGYLVDRFVRHGLRTAVQSNYGLEGSFDKVRTPYGEAMHYPKGFKPYSDDVIQLWHDDWKKKNPGVKSALMTLYDVWVYDQLKFDDPIFAYVPIDHVTMPPLVHKFLLRENVTPVTMSSMVNGCWSLGISNRFMHRTLWTQPCTPQPITLTVLRHVSSWV